MANCIYSEKELPVPEQLTKGEIVVAKNAYLAVGRDKNHGCLKKLSIVDRKIVRSGEEQYYTYGSNVLVIEPLKQNFSFQIVGIVAVTKHGITTIDSGSGPIYYLILKDKNNILYKIATVSFGLNQEDLFLAFKDRTQSAGNSSVKLLSPDSFNVTYQEGKESLTYTGKLTEVTDVYLESTEPQWKKLADRLERGEKFLIMVTQE